MTSKSDDTVSQSCIVRADYRNNNAIISYSPMSAAENQHKRYTIYTIPPVSIDATGTSVFCDFITKSKFSFVIDDNLEYPHDRNTYMQLRVTSQEPYKKCHYVKLPIVGPKCCEKWDADIHNMFRGCIFVKDEQEQELMRGMLLIQPGFISEFCYSHINGIREVPKQLVRLEFDDKMFDDAINKSMIFINIDNVNQNGGIITFILDAPDPYKSGKYILEWKRSNEIRIRLIIPYDNENEIKYIQGILTVIDRSP